MKLVACPQGHLYFEHWENVFINNTNDETFTKSYTFEKKLETAVSVRLPALIASWSKLKWHQCLLIKVVLVAQQQRKLVLNKRGCPILSNLNFP